MKKYLIIDDERTPELVMYMLSRGKVWQSTPLKELEEVTEENTFVAKNYAEGIKALQEQIWEILFLDHDLGEEKTGYDVVCWLEKNPINGPAIICLTTSNPVGRDRMIQVIQKDRQ